MSSVIIIGGGLSGLCLAHALAKHVGDVRVFERDAQSDGRGQGYRLTIDEAGSGALHACLPSKHYEFIRATAGRTSSRAAFIIVDDQGKELHRAAFDTASLERRGLISGQVDRHTLRQAMLDGLGRQVQFGKTFVGYREEGKSVLAQFEDGFAAQGDILVGADGTHSRVRRQWLPDAEPRDTGIQAIFGRTYLSAVKVPTLGPMLADGGIMAMGPRGSVFFCTSMRFRESPAVAAERIGIAGVSWPTQDYFMWGVVVPRSAIAAVATAAGDKQAVRGLAAQVLRGFNDDYHALVQHADPNDLILMPIRAAPVPAPVTPRRVTLIGDAAHTMPPFGAHGANTALRDSQTLATAVAGMSTSLDAIGAYESAMHGYSVPIVRSAVRTMTIATADFPLKHTLVKNALRAVRLFSRA